MALVDKILNRIKGYGRGAKVFAATDFVDLGSRGAIDRALARLAEAGTLRRLSRGLYDWPRHSKLLNKDAPARSDAVTAAIGKRAKAKMAPDNLAAANALGLTTAVWSNPTYVADRKIGDKKVDGAEMQFRPIGAKLAPLLATDAAVIVQALAWARAAGVDLDQAAATIRARAPRKAKAALAANLGLLPIWALKPAQAIVANRTKGDG